MSENTVNWENLPVALEYNICFISNWYDGPLTGHLWWQDKYCYFNCESFTKDNNRLYIIYELVGEDLKNELASRQLWSCIMGSYFEDNKTKSDKGAPNHKEYIRYSKSIMIPEIDLTKLKPIAICYLYNDKK